MATTELGELRVALVHDWVNGYRGGEKVLREFAELFPQSELFTLFHVPGSSHPSIERLPIHASWMNSLPGVTKRYRNLLPLFPSWADRLDLRGFDLVLSTSHCVAKGARAHAPARHLCYCHTPMRYVWDRFDDYFGHFPGPLRALIGLEARRLRAWDRGSADRVDLFLANSHFVRERIARFYGSPRRPIEVLHPPVDLAAFPARTRGESDRYLVVSALVPYKRIDVAVEACLVGRRSLSVAGSGPELPRLKRLVNQHPGADIRFLGFVPDAELPDLFATHRALLFPGVEDFGITPVEAMACGLPVIARGEGGALDSVVAGSTGLHYDGAGPEPLLAAMERFERERIEFDPDAMRAHAEGFDRPHFRAALAAHVATLLAS